MFRDLLFSWSLSFTNSSKAMAERSRIRFWAFSRILQRRSSWRCESHILSLTSFLDIFPKLFQSRWLRSSGPDVLSATKSSFRERVSRWLDRISHPCGIEWIYSEEDLPDEVNCVRRTYGTSGAMMHLTCRSSVRVSIFVKFYEERDWNAFQVSVHLLESSLMLSGEIRKSRALSFAVDRNCRVVFSDWSHHTDIG